MAPCALAGLAYSQGSGTIVGTVTDPSGAAVASAKLTAKESSTGTTRAVFTNAAADVLAALTDGVNGPTKFTYVTVHR